MFYTTITQTSSRVLRACGAILSSVCPQAARLRNEALFRLVSLCSTSTLRCKTPLDIFASCLFWTCMNSVRWTGRKQIFSFAKAVSTLLFPGSKLSRPWVLLAVCLGSCKREDSGRSSAQCSWTRRRPTPTPGCAPSAAVPGADYATAAPRFASQHPTTQRRWSDCGPPLTLPRIPRRVLWRVHGCAAMAGTKPGGVDCLMWPATAYCPGQQIQGP